MQIATDPSRPAAAPLFTIPQGQDVADERYSLFKVVRRNGSVVAFEPAKISIAVTKAFLSHQWRPRRRLGACARNRRAID